METQKEEQLTIDDFIEEEKREVQQEPQNNQKDISLYQQMVNIHKDPKTKKEFDDFLYNLKYANLDYKNKHLVFEQLRANNHLDVLGTKEEWEALGFKVDKKAKSYYVEFHHTISKIGLKDKNGKVKIMGFSDTIDKEVWEALKIQDNYYEEQQLAKFINKNLYSMSQTNAPENKRPEILQRWNKESTLPHPKTVYSRLIKTTEKLGCKINLDLKSHSEKLGYYSDKNIHLQYNMPTEASIAVLSHEIGHFLHKEFLQNYPVPELELEAQIFSHILQSNLGMTSQKYQSLKFMSNQLLLDESNKEKNEKTVEEIFDRMKPIADLFTDVINGQESIKTLKQFIKSHEVENKHFNEIENERER